MVLLLLLHLFNSIFSTTIWVSRHQTSKPFWILLEQEMMEWQWHQLDHMQIICTSLQTDNHTSTPPLSFLQTGCPSCCPTNSVKALSPYVVRSLKSVMHGHYDTRPTVTFLTALHHQPWTGTKLYCLMTATSWREQTAQSLGRKSNRWPLNCKSKVQAFSPSVHHVTGLVSGSQKIPIFDDCCCFIFYRMHILPDINHEEREMY